MGTRGHPVAPHYPYFVTATTADSRPAFRRPEAARWFITTLEDVLREQNARCLAYVVMPDHVHLIIVPGRLGLAHFMRFLKGRFARRWNQQAGSSGNMWQARYYESVIRSEERLQKAIEYIDQNPVKAGLCSRPQEFPYGSAGRFGVANAVRYLTSASQAEACPSVGVGDGVSRITR